MAPYAIPVNNTKNTLIQVWATWCPFCKKQNAYLEKLYKELPPNSLNVITISIDKNPLLAKQYMENNQYTFPAAMMTPELQKSMGKVKGIPILIILDKNNKIIYREIGEIFPEEYADLKRYLHLSEEPPAAASPAVASVGMATSVPASGINPTESLAEKEELIDGKVAPRQR
ncbi:MAG: TlpA family protein disulfide reductase, partial [Burkholderiaceae bacterium]|nr:TlpA family protein disulfide reductase [Burkholderiaceae bacterium]